MSSFVSGYDVTDVRYFFSDKISVENMKTFMWREQSVQVRLSFWFIFQHRHRLQQNHKNDIDRITILDKSYESCKSPTLLFNGRAPISTFYKSTVLICGGYVYDMRIGCRRQETLTDDIVKKHMLAYLDDPHRKAIDLYFTKQEVSRQGRLLGLLYPCVK